MARRTVAARPESLRLHGAPGLLRPPDAGVSDNERPEVSMVLPGPWRTAMVPGTGPVARHTIVDAAFMPLGR